MSDLRAAVLQTPHLDTVEANLALARERIREAAAMGARLVLLPEYFFAAPAAPSVSAARAGDVRALLRDASADHGVVAAGNVIERRGAGLANVGVAYESGRLAFEQPKVHPMPREAESGVAGGDSLVAGSLAGHPAGILVCADILYPEAARVLALQGAQILLNPVMSPYREKDPTRGARDSIFVARAYDSGAFVLKAGGFRRDGAHPVAGRSLVAAPWGLLARAADDFAEEILVADLDFARLHEFRKSLAGFPARRPDAYRPLVDP